MIFYSTADQELEQLMKPLLSAITRYFRRQELANRSTRTGQRKTRCMRLQLEKLEDRMLMTASISVANATINEIGGPSAFVTPGSGGLSGPRDLVLGPNGNVYVASYGTNSVIRYSAAGQLLGTFVAAGSGGLSKPCGLAFGPDGNLYVGSSGTNAVYEYSGVNGGFLSTFVTAGSGGLNVPWGIAFGPDANLYVSSQGSDAILRFEGPSDASPGTPLPASGQSGATFVAQVVPPSTGGGGPQNVAFGPDGNL